MGQQGQTNIECYTMLARALYPAFLRTFSTDTTGQLHIFQLDRDTLGVHGAQIGILKETHEVSFGRFLKSQDSRGLKADISPDAFINLTNQTLERKLANEKVGRL